MTIHQAAPKDVAAIQACAAEAYEKYVERMGRKPAPMVADFAQQVRQKTVHVSVGRQGEIEGFIVFYPRADHVHLENVAVCPRRQRQGVGKKLIAYCENAARKMGLRAIELYTNEKMTENLTLYPRLGYEETGRRTEDGFNRVFFRKEI